MAGPFPDTRWTLIQKARADEGGVKALDEWCRCYWRPIHAYICSRGYDPEGAKELAQAFFERLISRGAGESLPGELMGPFRAYLMRSVKNFLTDQWRADQSQRRGGALLQADSEILDGLGDGRAGPERIFDQRWILTVIELAMIRLQNEMNEKGSGDFFMKTKHLLDGRGLVEEDRAGLAESLGMKVGAFRVALHRMRARLRILIEDEVRETVTSEAEFREEICYLFEVWS